MFEKFKKRIKTKKEQYKHRRYYNLKIDNVAIPEIHTHEEEQEEHPEHVPINYDNVAIPEVHIRTKRK